MQESIMYFVYFRGLDVVESGTVCEDDREEQAVCK